MAGNLTNPWADDRGDEGFSDLFREPDGYLMPEKPYTHETVRLPSGQEVALRLVGSSPLWGHLLWNAARTMTAYLIDNATTLVRDRTVLEVGAGAGLPSLVCASLKAKTVVASDYPDAALIDNLQYNIDTCALLSPEQKQVTIHARGHLWGTSVKPLLDPLGPPVVDAATGIGSVRFDTVLSADALFNHATHTSLLRTIAATLSRTGTARALLFFTPHRPWLLDKDLEFFTLATAAGFVARRIVEQWYDEAMFEGEAKWEGRKPPPDWQTMQPGKHGDIRRVVWGYEMAWADSVEWTSSIPRPLSGASSAN